LRLTLVHKLELSIKDRTKNRELGSHSGCLTTNTEILMGRLTIAPAGQNLEYSYIKSTPYPRQRGITQCLNRALGVDY